MNRFIGILSIALACMTATPALQAANWVGANLGDPSWFTAGNWDTASVPTAADVAAINNTSIAGVGGIYTAPLISGGSAAANQVQVGFTSPAELNMSGGDLTVGGYIRVGSLASSNSVFNFSGGTITKNASGLSTRFGNSATDASGTLNMSGNAYWHQLGDNIFVGFGGNGTVTMSGTSKIVQDSAAFFVGCGSSGAAFNSVSTLTMSGSSTLTVPQLRVGLTNGGTGTTYSGTVSVLGNSILTVTNGSFAGLNIGDGAAGASGELVLGLADHSDNPTIRVVNNGAWGDGWLRCGNGVGASGTVTVNSGLFDLSHDLAYDDRGTFDIGANGSTGTFTQTGGTVITNLGGTNLGEGATSIATLNLNGGVFKTSQVRPSPWDDNAGTTSTVNFNGGTLTALTNNATLVRAGAGTFTAKVLEGGAKIDSGVYSVGLSVPLVHAGVAPIDGGLTKLGSGNLTLSAAGNSYTGATLVQAGQLTLDTGPSEASVALFANMTTITVRPGAALASGPNSWYDPFVNVPLLADVVFDAKSTYAVSVTETGYARALSVMDISAGAGTGPAVIRLNGADSSVPVQQAAVLYYQTKGNGGTGVPSFIPWVDSIGQNDLGFTDSGSSIDLATPNMAGMRGWISGVWSANASWLEGTAPTTSADKAWFDSAVSGGAGGTVTLDLPVVLSSMLFKTSSTGYTIAPATAADTITLSSSIAADAQIQSLSGDNVIAANIITTTGDPIIGVSPGSKLTITGAISGPGTLSVNGLGNGASVTPTNGILALQGANTFTGPVIMTGYGRLEVNQFVASTSTPSPLGQSGPDAANLVIQGTLAYTGTTDATTNRGFTLSGNGVLNQIEVPASTNLTITGQVVGNTQSTALRKIGDGTLTLANSGTGNTLPTAQLVVSTGKLVFENGTYTKNISAGLAFLKTDGWPDWDGEGGIYVGKNGTSAEVVIQNGATVVNQGETWLGYMNNSQGSITINDTGTLTANNSVHLGVYYNGSDAAPAPKGTITLNGSAKLNVNGGNLTVGQWAEGHLNVHGSAQVAVVNDMVVGDNWGDNPVTQQSNGNVTIDSATASIGVSRRILIGWSGGTGHWNQDAGQTTANSGVVIGNAYDVGSEGDGFLNLNGGVFTTPSIVTGATLGGSPAATVATVNLNGGTLKATRNNSDYLANATGATFSANVLKNATTGLGAVIDTNGYNVGINRALTHGGVVTDGGVTKIGAGALTLANAANTFDGGTNIVAGKVVSDMPGALGTGAVNFTGANTTLSVGYSAPVSSVGTFSASGSNWNLGGNGPASISGDTLTITTNNGDLANSAIYNRKVSTQDFTASFTYLDATGGGADGFTFLLQTNGQSAVGGGGGGLGYSGVINSVALEGNVYGGSGIRIAQNGATGGYTAPGTVDLTSNANPTTFTLVYHTSTDTLDVTLDQPGLAANYTTSYAGIGLAGLGDVYVGFTGGTGGLSAQQNISNFSYSAGASTAPLASTVYGNALTVAAGISANVNVLASAAQPTVTMGNLALASGSALNVAAEVGTPADLAYGLTLGSATLAGPATLAVADNGAGLGTLTLASVAGTGSLTKTGAGSLDVVGSIAMAGDTIVNQGTVNATGGINTPANAVYVSTGTTLNASSIVADSLTIGGGPYAAAATASVPEPCTFVLLALAGLGALLVWRRK